jgi:hypothetical protein
MGDFGMGHMISHDGKTIMDDANAFGQEWQVLDSEPKLQSSFKPSASTGVQHAYSRPGY